MKSFPYMMKLSAIAGLAMAMMLTAFNASAKEIKQKYNGLTINGNLVMADGKTLKDEVVLLTHGTLTRNDRETYTLIQELLAENGIRSLAINLSLGGSMTVTVNTTAPHHILTNIRMPRKKSTSG